MIDEKIKRILEKRGRSVRINGDGTLVFESHGLQLYAGTEEKDPHYVSLWSYICITPKEGVDESSARKTAEHLENVLKCVKIGLLAVHERSFSFRVGVESLTDADNLERIAGRIVDIIHTACSLLQEKLSE